MSASSIVVQPLTEKSTVGLSEHWFAMILAAQRTNKTALPHRLGLNHIEFQELLERFPKLRKEYGVANLNEASLLRDELWELREEEVASIRSLLEEFANTAAEGVNWMSTVVASACLGSHHLWKDLGLLDRENLRQLLTYYYPKLVDKNIHNMRWKKFLYRQLCETGGDFVCRSPSCETCSTYQECFGEE